MASIPMPLGDASRLTVLIAGTTLLLGGLGLYLAGMRELGAAFAPSSGFGVRLQRLHGLVTDGVFRWLRHPMYAGVVCASCGVLLIYRTWSGLALAVTMLGLVFRARREEGVLARRYGVEWDAYARSTPAWFPAPWRRADT